MLISSPVVNADGTVRFISHRVEDVTERVIADRKQGESEARLAAIFESLPVGVGVAATEGSLVLSNQEMQRFWPTGLLPSRKAWQWRWRGHQPDGRLVEPDNFPGARALRGSACCRVPKCSIRKMTAESFGPGSLPFLPEFMNPENIDRIVASAGA